MRVGIFTDNDFDKINGVTTTLKAVLRYADDGFHPRVYTASDLAVDTPSYFATASAGVGLPWYRDMPCELVQHGRTGLVAKGRNAQDMLAAIEHLLDHAELRRQMSSDCRSYAEGCGWENAYANFWNSQSGPEIGAVSGAGAVVVRAAAGER